MNTAPRSAQANINQSMRAASAVPTSTGTTAAESVLARAASSQRRIIICANRYIFSRMKRHTSLLIILISCFFTATTAFAQTNPFFSPSPLQFQAPQFDKIKDSDYQPALEEGMKRQIAEMEAIANSTDAPTFANTIEAMERTGDLLTRTAKVFFNLAQSNTNDALQKIEAEEA